MNQKAISAVIEALRQQYRTNAAFEPVTPKTKDEEGDYSRLTVGELRRQLENLLDDMEVYIRTCHNSCGNIVAAGTADISTYGSFGASIPCVVVEPAFQGYVIQRR